VKSKKRSTTKKSTKASKPKKRAVESQVVTTISEPALEHGLEDAGNGERFVEQHGENVRHVHKWKRWLVWNGCIWSEEDDGTVQQMAKATAQSIYREANSRPEIAKYIRAHAKNTLSVAGRARMLDSASDEPDVRAKPTDFNSDPMLFNVLNGTINLKTGELQPHEQCNLITKIAPVEYHPDAKDNLWTTFLDQMVPDDAIREYLQRACFYTLMGAADVHVLFFDQRQLELPPDDN